MGKPLLAGYEGAGKEGLEAVNVSLCDLSPGKEGADEEGHRSELANDNSGLPLELKLGGKISRWKSGARIVEEDFFTHQGRELHLGGGMFDHVVGRASQAVGDLSPHVRDVVSLLSSPRGFGGRQVLWVEVRHARGAAKHDGEGGMDSGIVNGRVVGQREGGEEAGPVGRAGVNVGFEVMSDPFVEHLGLAVDGWGDGRRVPMADMEETE